MFKRPIALLVCLTFIFSDLQYVHAQDFSIDQLPVPGTMVGESAPFSPLALKGLVVNPQKPLEFQFIVDTGRGPQDTGSIKDQSSQLVKYFLSGITIPEGDLWVNLSPYEKNRMVPVSLGQTDLGRDLLAQDYILKQLTASLIYPEKDLGKEFWSRVYSKAQQQFGTTNIPVSTFNKVWILPNQAQVFENGNAAYVTKSTLKVMLDEDYTALHKHKFARNDVASVGANIVRAIILPEIEKEVNTGKNFAPLRQIYQALILAKWYKETIQNGLLDAIYTNKNKVSGVNLNDPAVKEEIYQRYLKAYKKGAFNYIKDDPAPVGQAMPRRYFSGGIDEIEPRHVSIDGAMSAVKSDGAMLNVQVNLEKTRDEAMLSNEDKARIIVGKAWKVILEAKFKNPPEYWEHALDQFNTLPFNDRIRTAKSLMQLQKAAGVSTRKIMAGLSGQGARIQYFNTIKRISSIADFMNEQWQQEYMGGIRQGINSFMILQPDAVKGDILDKVTGLIKKAGFRVELGPEMVLTTDMVRQIRGERPVSRDLVNYMTESPVRLLFIWGDAEHTALDLAKVRREQILPALGVGEAQKIRRKSYIPNKNDMERVTSFLLQAIHDQRNVRDTYNPAYVVDGAYRPPLSPQDIKFLTPKYDTVKAFWASNWRQTHPDSALFYIIRHQESVSNVSPRVSQARRNFSPPTPEGALQKARMAEFLRGIWFDAFFASDSERAYLTLKALWDIQGHKGQMPYDRRLEELNMMPRGAVEPEKGMEVFDPDRLLELYPQLFRNVSLESYPYYESEINSFYHDVTSGAHEGQTIAIGTHGASIKLQLMTMGGIGVEKIKTVNDFMDATHGPYPNVGISIASYDLKNRKWKLLVYGDNSYLPENLRQGSKGVLARVTKGLGSVQAVGRKIQLMVRQGRLHEIHRDYFPRGDVSWTWNVLSPEIEQIQERHKAFLTRYLDRELWQEFWSTPNDAAMFSKAQIGAWKLVHNVNKIAAMLGDEDQGVRQAAEKALADLGASKEERVNGYIAALSSRFTNARRNAIEELAKLGDKRAIGPLLGMLNNGYQEIQASQRVLAELGASNEEMVKGYIAVLTSGVNYYYDILNAVRKLGDLLEGHEDERVVELLKSRMTTKDRSLRQAIEESLIKMERKEVGGIDLNQINVKRSGKTVKVQFDPAQLDQLMQGGFEGFTPVIINITPIASPFPLLGIHPAIL